MTELRRRMIRDMTVRGFSPRTHEAYLSAVRRLAKHYGRPPDELSSDEIQDYLVHLVTKRKLSSSTCNIAANAFRFLYRVTLGRDATTFEVPASKQPQRLPEILSRDEVARLIASPPNPKHRLMLATIYAGGLRVSEAVQLKVSAVDRGRMTLRVEQGKGRKDRILPLSRRLMEQMEAYWQTEPPRLWLFPNRTGQRHVDVTVLQKVFTMAKLRTGIRKRGGIHSLRHAFATHLIESGADVPTVQRLLGHRSVSTTMRYFHLSQARLSAIRSPLDLLDASV
ncbi:MAG: tyrosine-type recombinase/integrase [Gemmatimonadetes bacterium]|nr:tyrosine-type recombinase/integrase [Gemmatimonadota bacterium]